MEFNPLSVDFFRFFFVVVVINLNNFNFYEFFCCKMIQNKVKNQ